MCLLRSTNWVSISQKTTFFIVSAEKVSNLTLIYLYRSLFTLECQCRCIWRPYNLSVTNTKVRPTFTFHLHIANYAAYIDMQLLISSSARHNYILVSFYANYQPLTFTQCDTILLDIAKVYICSRVGTCNAHASINKIITTVECESLRSFWVWNVIKKVWCKLHMFIRWHINHIAANLDNIHRPVVYLKHAMDNVRTSQKTHYVSTTYPTG
jgi:hypothetical protein